MRHTVFIINFAMQKQHAVQKTLNTYAMSTIIYPSPIFGPVHSRRLGLSLGINLMPGDGKICTFDCIYCECGFNKDGFTRSKHPSRELVAEKLEKTLIEMHEQGEHPDVLTFAGNGEPTSHPHFPEIIEDTIRLRDKWCPGAKISVLSNATHIGHEKTRAALMRVDNNIQKLDTVDDEFIRAVDRPVQPSYTAARVVENMKLFNGHVIIQTMFLKSDHLDNTQEKYVGPWLDAVLSVKPEKVMIYTIDRETPDQSLRKATPEELDAIRDRVIAAGVPCSAAY